MRCPAALALPVLLGLAACRTADRLWRISPFEGSPASDRVNLWPLAYHNGDETSVLWPLFDLDQRGFALRPLMAKDGTGYSILFPLASFDTDAGEGWVGPFYQFEGMKGLFPLVNLGPLSWIGPVWWSEAESGLFPVAHFGATSYVGPVWWTESEEGPWAGLFPVAMFGPVSYVGPFWWTGPDSWGVLPLFGKNLLGSGIDHVTLAWWRNSEEEGFEGGLWPLVDYGDGGRRFSLLPLYSHDLGPDERTRNVLLGLGRTSRTDEREESWLLPLYYHRAEPEKSDTALLPFFWKYTRGERSEVYTLLGNRFVDPESSTFNLYPFWWSNENTGEDSAWKMLVPLFYYGREGDERTLITPLGGRGWSDSGTEAFVNVLGPLFHHSRSVRRDESRTAFLWPLFERHRRGVEHTTRALGLYSHTASPGESETYYALGLGHAHTTVSGGSHRFWPLYSWTDGSEEPGLVDSLTLYGRTGHDDTVSQRLFPLFSSERSGDSSSWYALLGLVHHESAGAARSSSWWAWPLAARSSGVSGPGFLERTTLLGSSRWTGGRLFQLGSSLLYSRTVEESAETKRESSRALLLFTHTDEELVGRHVPAAEAGRSQNRIQHESRGFLFDAFVSEHSTYHVWREGALQPKEASVLRAFSVPGAREGLPDRAAVRSVLAAHGVECADDQPATLRAAIDSFSDANTETLERSHFRIPLVCGYEHSDSERSWYGPLGLVSFERDAEHERFSLLYYGYRSETKDGRTSRDIFPFVTWDSGPDETRWSFLWHFLHYERRGERRGGHVLFVPLGDA
jgi:hypothetical protein